MKYYYYVGVMSMSVDDDSLKYVYKVDCDTSYVVTAYFGTYKELREKNEKPKKFSLKYAKDIVKYLSASGYDAFVITTTADYR